MSAKINGLTASSEMPERAYRGISASLSKAIVDNVALKSAKLTSGGQTLFEGNIKTPFYLFGRQWFDLLLQPDFPPLKPNFGDWSHDKIQSVPKPIYSEELPKNFELTVTFMGRGDGAIVFDGEQKLTLNLRDGHIENDFSICDERKCYFTGFGEKPTSLNLRRILNFFVEILLSSLLILHGFTILNWIVSKIPIRASVQTRQSSFNMPKFMRVYVPIIILLHFCICVWFNLEVLGGIPHIPDSAVGYRQAIMLSQGLLGVKLPQILPIEAMVSNGGINLDGFLVYHYNHFWPAILAIFVFFGVPSICNPILSCLSLFLIIYLSRRYLSDFVAVVAGIIYVSMPFTTIMAGDYMNHHASLCLFLAFLFFLERISKTDALIWRFLAGLVMGYGLAVRPVSFVALLFPLTTYLLIYQPKHIFRMENFIGLVGLAIILTLLVLDNHYLTGDFLVSPYQKYHTISFGFQNLQTGTTWSDATLSYLPPISYASPFLFFILGLAFIWIFLERRQINFLLSATFLSVISFYFFVNVYGIHGYGPRFYFEGMAFMNILAAVGVGLLFTHFKARNMKIVLALIFISSLGYDLVALARDLPAYNGYNAIETRTFVQLKKLDLPHSLVFTKSQAWQGLDIAAALFDPTFKQNIFVYVKDESELSNFLKAYPGRKVFEISGVDVIERPDLIT